MSTGRNLGLTTIRKARAKQQSATQPKEHFNISSLPSNSPVSTILTSTEDVPTKLSPEDKFVVHNEFKSGENRVTESKNEEMKLGTALSNFKERVNSATKKIIEKAEQVIF